MEKGKIKTKTEGQGAEVREGSLAQRQRFSSLLSLSFGAVPPPQKKGGAVRVKPSRTEEHSPVGFPFPRTQRVGVRGRKRRGGAVY